MYKEIIDKKAKIGVVGLGYVGLPIALALARHAAVIGFDIHSGRIEQLKRQEDPSGDSIEKLVNSVVGEKLEDGQLDESSLTFGDLTRVKRAIVDALIGYYHTRIPYPGFPGAQVEGV